MRSAKATANAFRAGFHRMVHRAAAPTAHARRPPHARDRTPEASQPPGTLGSPTDPTPATADADHGWSYPRQPRAHRPHRPHCRATGRTWTTTHPWSSSKRTSLMTVFSAPRTHAIGCLHARRSPAPGSWSLTAQKPRPENGVPPFRRDQPPTHQSGEPVLGGEMRFGSSGGAQFLAVGRVGWWGRLFGRVPMYRLGVLLVSSVGGFSAASD